MFLWYNSNVADPFWCKFPFEISIMRLKQKLIFKLRDIRKRKREKTRDKFLAFAKTRIVYVSSFPICMQNTLYPVCIHQYIPTLHRAMYVASYVHQGAFQIHEYIYVYIFDAQLANILTNGTCFKLLVR